MRHNLLWVSGAATGKAAVYNLKTGEPVDDADRSRPRPSFINDVIVTATPRTSPTAIAGDLQGAGLEAR